MKKIPKSFQTALWSYDINKLDAEKDKEDIIEQVLNHGKWEDLKLLFKMYPEEEIKQVIKNPSRGVWFEKVLNFWEIIFNLRIDKEVRQKAIFNIFPH